MNLIQPYTPDRVTDFNVREDIVILDHIGGQRLTDLGIDQFIRSDQFNVGTKATTLNHRIIYHQITGEVFLDPDGSGAQAQTHILTLSAGLPVSPDNFFVTDDKS